MQDIRWLDRLSSLLVERGMTQDQFARRLGTSQASVSRWLTKQSSPRNDMEQRIADELGVSRQWLMTGEGSKEQERIYANKNSSLALQRTSWRYDDGGGKEPDPSAVPSAGDERVREMRASIRLLISDHTDLQIIARMHEMLDDKNFSMPYRLLLVQTLLDELHHRYKSPLLPEP